MKRASSVSGERNGGGERFLAFLDHIDGGKMMCANLRDLLLNGFLRVLDFGGNQEQHRFE